MQAGLGLGPNKIFYSLADTPAARVPLAGRPEKLDNFGRQRRGVQQKPALIEHRDAWSSGLSSGSRSHRARDEHAHCCFKSRIGAETFDVEEEPIAIQLHRGRSVEEVRVDATLSRPRA